MSNVTALRLIRAVHTVIWAFFVGCIVGAPLAASRGNFRLAAILIALVAAEGLVLLANRGACPLTAVAARHTSRREPNFDIYLPLWLARHNKAIFTPLYLLGAGYTVVAWWQNA